MLDIARKTAKLVELGKEIADDDVVLIEDYAYPVYGVPSQETKEAIRLTARLEGMITDPVYEGKSMQGMIDLVKKGFFPGGSKVLFAHLGGAPRSTATPTRSATGEIDQANQPGRQGLEPHSLAVRQIRSAPSEREAIRFDS